MNTTRVGVAPYSIDVAIDCPSGPIADAVCALWAPYLVSPAKGLSIEVRDEQNNTWSLTVEGQAQHASPVDEWELLSAISSHVFQHVTKRISGWLPFHAAVVAGNQSCVLLAGRTGAGKSTLCHEFVSTDGWSYMSDDVALIAPDGSVHPFFKPLSIKDPARWFDFDLGDFPVFSPPVTEFVVPASLLPIHDQPEFPTHLAFVSYESGIESSEARGLSTGEALIESARYVPRADVGTLGLLRTLCERTHPVMLSFGSASEAMIGLQSHFGWA